MLEQRERPAPLQLATRSSLSREQRPEQGSDQPVEADRVHGRRATASRVVVLLIGPK